VYEIPAAGGYATVNTLASGLAGPSCVAVDGSGNVFFAEFDGTDAGGNYNEAYEVREILAAGGYTTVKTLADGFITAGGVNGIAVDATGNIFVSYSYVIPSGPDYYSANLTKEILAAGGYTTVNTLGSFGGSGAAVDGSGNVFLISLASIPVGSASIIKLDYADPPTFSFPPTPLGATSSPESVQFQNVGNQPLTGSGSGVLYNTIDFAQVFKTSSLQDCSAGLSLAPGAECNLSLVFTPQSAGILSGTLTLTDNSLNGNPATQTINLEGPGGTVAPVFAPNPGIYQSARDVTLSDRTPGAVIYYTLDGTMPTNKSTQYTAPIPVTWQDTINAIAISSDGNSTVVSATYAIDRPLPPPTFGSPSGTYSAPFTLTLTPDPTDCKPGGCDLYYTINGNDGAGYKKCTGPVTITRIGTSSVRTFETAFHYTTSTPVTVTYQIQAPE